MAQTKILNDRYEIEATLGEGGMARVYRGTDRVLGRTVAIKVLAGKYAGDERFVTRFRREAQAAAGLNHPNIVGIYDTGDDGDMHYIVMEYIKGETLADLLRRQGKLDPDRAAAIADDVATALSAAHERSLVHRDVKPGNVMIDSEGGVKVMDFGIARAAADDTLTQTGTVLGTASYLSPEQAQGLPVDARSDIYSLGCVLYEMVTGQAPFTGESPVSIAYKHVNEDPRPPSEIEPSVPEALDTAVMRALAKDPEDRFPSADDFRAALAGAGTATVPIAAGGDTEIMPAAAPPTTVPSPQRTWSWVPVVLIVAAALALAGILALTLGDGERAGPAQDQQPPPETPAQETPTEEPTTPAALSVEDSFAALEGVVNEAIEGGLMSEDAGQKVFDKANAAGDKYFNGDLEGALAELGKAHEETDKALDEGEVTSDAAAAVHQAIDAVAQAMQASPPAPPEEEEEDDGFVPPGLVKKGKGKGQGKGDD